MRLDVLVSFGLLTSSENPELSGYLRAVERIVQSKLAASSSLQQQKVEYDPEFKPYIKTSEWDATYTDPSGRTDVKRQLVVAGVPVFMPDDSAIDSVRDTIVSGLQQAIGSGEFVELALGGN